MDTYTLWNLKRAPHTVSGEGGAQWVLQSCRLGSPAAADRAGQRCRSAGHRRGRRGAAGPQARSLPAPSPSPRLSRLSGEKPGLYPGTGRKQQPNCSSDRLLGKGGSAFSNFSHLSLSVSAFCCPQNLQRFAYFDSSGVRAVLGSTRR